MNIIQRDTSQQVLKHLAALVWYSGVVALLIKSTNLLTDAMTIKAGVGWIISSIFTGIILGWLKGKYLFTPLCKKNLKRIEALEHPKIWQFYRIQFFIFLVSMITLGQYLSQLAQGDYIFLLSLVILELSIAIALLLSSACFWHK